MNIVYVTDQLMDGASAAAVHVDEVCTHVAERGHTVTLIAPRSHARGHYSPAYQTISLSVPRLVRSTVYQPKLAWELGRLFLHGHTDCLYMRRSHLLFVPVLIARLFRVPVVLEINGLIEQDATYVNPNLLSRFLLHTGIFKLIEWVNIRLASHIVAVAPGLKESLQKIYTLDDSKITCIQNGVNTEIFTERDTRATRGELGLPEAFTIGYVGSLYTWQGLRHIIHAASIVLKARPHVRFCIVGKGSDSAYLEEYVTTHALSSSVSLIPETDYHLLAKYKSAFEVGLCYPLKMRSGLTSPMKIYEYLSCGDCVVSSDIGGLREEFGDVVVYVEPENPEKLAEALIDLIDHPEKVQMYRALGRPFIEKGKSWKVVTAELCALMEKVSVR